MNPRTIKGRAWWDEKRQEAYATNNECCWACGTHKSQAHYKQWLEAHEHYEIDYGAGIVRLKEIVALCRACHNFIHSQRMYALYGKDVVSARFVLGIIGRGRRILRVAGIEDMMFPGTVMVEMVLNGADCMDAYRESGMEEFESMPIAKWDEWYLELEGEKYYSQFKDIEEWREFYSLKDNG